MSKPSILFINRVYPPMRGATGRLLRDLALALDKTGWRVTVLTTGERACWESEQNIEIQRVKAVKNHKSLFGYALTWCRLYKAAKKLEAHDIVLTVTDPPLLSLMGSKLARLKKMKHVHWCQDVYPDLFPLLGVKLPDFIFDRLQRKAMRVLRSCSKVVVIGRCMADYLKKKGLHPHQMEIITNWADFEVIAPSGDASHHLLPVDIAGIAKKPEEMFRDDSPKFRILYAGNIGRAHPMRPIIEAAEILADHKEIEFVFIGDKHTHSTLAQERARRGLENIKFMPYQPIEKLREVMESGDIHLVTMRQEVKGCLVPCKFYSGLTVGRPTIFVGPANTEVAKVIKDYEAGKVVSVGRAKALAEVIYNYRHDGDAWFKAQEGALRAAQAYHPNQSLNKWLDVLEKARVS